MKRTEPTERRRVDRRGYTDDDHSAADRHRNQRRWDNGRDEHINDNREERGRRRDRVDSWGRDRSRGGGSGGGRHMGNIKFNPGDQGRDRRSSHHEEDQHYKDNEKGCEPDIYCRKCDTRLEDEGGRVSCPRCTHRARGDSGRDRHDHIDEHERHRKKIRMSSDDHHRDDRPKFPGPFEIYAEDYILDPTSGYFYQAWTGFFHCPKTKLYFHQKSARYFSFDKDEDIYVDVDNDYGMAKMKMKSDQKEKVDNGDDLVVQALQGAKKTTGLGVKNKISITIKSSKKMVAKKTKMEAPPSKCARGIEIQKSQQKKAHQNDIKKWSQRAKVCETSSSASRNPSASHLPENRRVRKTKSGKPVCMLCKRKFVDLDKLENHNSLSELHKFNLSKARSSINDPTRSYLDRALNRRNMYDDQNAPVATILDSSEIKEMTAPNLEKAREVLLAEAVRPEDILGTGNIGNKMLQKLGWKGGALGRNEAIGGRNESEMLKKDWERIEKAARS